jgi:hypothetical protein
LHDKKSHQMTTSLISWANANAAPILSLDFPSGNQHAQGRLKKWQWQTTLPNEMY